MCGKPYTLFRLHLFLSPGRKTRATSRLKNTAAQMPPAALVKPLLAEMTAARAAKAQQKEQETGRETVKSGEGISAEDRMKITMQFSLLQLIRMGAPDMPKERIIAINKQLNQIPSELNRLRR